MKTAVLSAVAAALLLGSASPAHAESPAPAVLPRLSVDEVVDGLGKLTELREVAISPDGARVAWVESARDKDGPLADKTLIRVVDRAAPGEPRRITAATEDRDERGLAWSPDGKQLAFFSDAEKAHQQQLYVLDVTDPAAKPRKLTALTGTLGSPLWAPSGKWIAFLYLAGREDTHGALGAAPRETGVALEQVPENRITVVDLAGGAPREISPPDLFVYEYDVSPDGTTFVGTAAHGEGDANWWVADLYTFQHTGEAKRLLQPELQLAAPKFSPDGKTIAFIGGLMSDFGLTGGDIYLIPTVGGPTRNLTPGLKSTPSALTWVSPAKLNFTQYVGGHSGIATVTVPPLGAGTVTSLWTGAENISDGSPLGAAFARDGNTVALIRQSFTLAPEVWAGPIGAWTQVSKVQPAHARMWGDGTLVRWKSDGQEVEGWLVAPPNVEPGKKYPMVMWVHGGPAYAVTPSYAKRANAVASQGYFVFQPNPRGSLGHGAAFTQGNRKDFGGGDFRDLQRGVDAALKAAPIDADRVGIAGWSYGGYMSMWAVTQTNRFRAALAGAGISNWQSYYGTNRIDTWLIPFYGASVYDAPALYAKASPITFIKKVKTPTLILSGERDSEVPVTQSREFWHALRTLGVDTQLVVYADEGHSPRRPANRRDMLRRELAWWEKYLAPRAAEVKPAK